MRIDSRGFPLGDMRVSDADRDRAVAELSAQFQIGRLTQEEFGERSGRALQARTGHELTELFADLPLGPEAAADIAPVAGAGPAPGAMTSVGGSPPARRIPRKYVVLCVIAVIIASARVVVNGHQVHWNLGLLVPVLVILFIMRRFARR
jgi:hypothetical protein